MVILNNSNEVKSKYKTFAKHSKNTCRKDILTNQLIDISHEITLEPKSVLILELQYFTNNCL
jgi:hypothetical protein